MAAGEPGPPARFVRRDETYTVAGVREKCKETDDCDHGSGRRAFPGSLR